MHVVKNVSMRIGVLVDQDQIKLLNLGLKSGHKFKATGDF